MVSNATESEAPQGAELMRPGRSGLARLSGNPVLRWIQNLDVPIVVLAVGLAFAFSAGNVQFLLATMAIYALLAMSANMLVGWHGTMTFGHAAFFGVGLYFVALMRESGLNPFLLVAIAGVLGGVVGLLFGLLTIRLSGIGFAMMTLVFGQVLYLLVFTIPALQGDNGIPSVPAGKLFGLNLSLPRNFWWYALIVIGVCFLLIKMVYRSSFGRTVLAVRDDALRAAALGVPVRAVRIMLIGLSGFFAAVAGALFVQQQSIASADMIYWLTSGELVLMCLIGGTGYFWGPVLGAALFVWLDSQLFKDISYSSLYVGIIFLAVVLLFRGGIAGLPHQISGWLRRWRSRREAKAVQA